MEQLSNQQRKAAYIVGVIVSLALTGALLSAPFLREPPEPTRDLEADAPRPAAGACIDDDGDGYYAGEENPATSPCRNRSGYRGLEKMLCDCPDLAAGQPCKGVILEKSHLLPLIDSENLDRALQGRQFHPGAPDAPGDGMDLDCDGIDISLCCGG